MAQQSLTTAGRRFADSLDNIATTLVLAHRERGTGAAVFFGSHPGDGTSTTVIGTARAVQRLFGLRTLVVEANHRHPVMRDLFGLAARGTLARFGRGECELADIVTTAGDGLSLIAIADELDAGAMKSAGPEILQKLATAARDAYELLLVDAPAVAHDPEDYRMIAAVPARILVIASGSTRYEVLSRMSREFAARDIELLGVVLNKQRHFIPDWLYRNWFQ